MKFSTFRHAKPWLLLATIVVLVNVPAIAKKPIVDWDHELDMSGWKTFVWAEDSIKPSEDLSIARVESAIVDALKAKGIQPAEDDEGDFIVRYHTIVDQQTQQSSVRVGLGLSRRVGSHGAINIGVADAPHPHRHRRRHADCTHEDEPVSQRPTRCRHHVCRYRIAGACRRRTAEGPAGRSEGWPKDAPPPRPFFPMLPPRSDPAVGVRRRQAPKRC